METRLDRLNQDYRTAINHKYGLAHNVCVSGEEQKYLISILTQVEIGGIKEGCQGKTIILHMMKLEA